MNDIATMNDIIDYSVRHRAAVDVVVAFCVLIGLCASARQWRLLYVFVSIAALAVGVFASLQLTAVPIHAFDQSWDVHHGVPLDAHITRMAKRAQFDSYVCGLPTIGRGKLHLDLVTSHGSDYDLFFTPSVSDTFVVYRFKANGKAMWKTFNGIESLTKI
jgi:hypothetical protein